MAKKMIKSNRSIDGWTGSFLKKCLTFVFQMNPISYELDKNRNLFIFYYKKDTFNHEVFEKYKSLAEDQLPVEIVEV